MFIVTEYAALNLILTFYDLKHEGHEKTHE